MDVSYYLSVVAFLLIMIMKYGSLSNLVLRPQSIAERRRFEAVI